MLPHLYSTAFLATLIVRSFSAVIITSSFEQKAIVPTTPGQLGINPVTDLGPVSQYVAEIGPNNNVLVIENGVTQWKGSNSLYFTETSVTRTLASTTETVVVPVQASISKATASANGMLPGDVSITIVPDLKAELEVFASEAVEACKLVSAVKRELDVSIATHAFTECLHQKAVDATRKGGRLERLLESVDLEAGDLIPDVPAGPSAEIDLWAAAMQIAKNEVRKKGAWVLGIILVTYTTNKVINYSYRIPKEPIDIYKTLWTPTPTQSCKSGAPTGANAPVCGDEGCQGLPMAKKCSLGEWQECDCLGSIDIDNPIGVVEPAWLLLQQEVLEDIENTPDEGWFQCEANSPRYFDGTPRYNPADFCICANVWEVSSSLFPSLPSPTSACAYDSLPETQMTLSTISQQIGGVAVTSCRTVEATALDGPFSSCTCNDNQGYGYRTPTVIGTETVTETGCDYILRDFGPTSTISQDPGQPTATQGANLPDAQDVQSGKLYCPSKKTLPEILTPQPWYMRKDLVVEKMGTYCQDWDFKRFEIGPGNMTGYDGKYDVYDIYGSPLPDKYTIYFDVEFIDGDDCTETIHMGTGDNSDFCRGIFSAIVDTCDPPDGGPDHGKQGGRFERDCFRWQVERCDVHNRPDCLFPATKS